MKKIAIFLIILSLSLNITKAGIFDKFTPQNIAAVAVGAVFVGGLIALTPSLNSFFNQPISSFFADNSGSSGSNKPCFTHLSNYQQISQCLFNSR
jgi:hypothetical protein